MGPPRCSLLPSSRAGTWRFEAHYALAGQHAHCLPLGHPRHHHLCQLESKRAGYPHRDWNGESPPGMRGYGCLWHLSAYGGQSRGRCEGCPTGEPRYDGSKYSAVEPLGTTQKLHVPNVWEEYRCGISDIRQKTIGNGLPSGNSHDRRAPASPHTQVSFKGGAIHKGPTMHYTPDVVEWRVGLLTKHDRPPKGSTKSSIFASINPGAAVHQISRLGLFWARG